MADFGENVLDLFHEFVEKSDRNTQEKFAEAFLAFERPLAAMFAVCPEEYRSALMNRYFEHIAQRVHWSLEGQGSSDPNLKAAIKS